MKSYPGPIIEAPYHRFWVVPLALIFGCLLLHHELSAQIISGTNGYVEYHPGDIPIVISVPHGGYLMPAQIPDRSCQNPVFAQDAFTLELAQRIDSSFREMTGCRPHIIYCMLHRRKLDANRNLSAAACGQPDAVQAWTEYMDFITQAQQAATAQYGGKVFFIDLHGHGNPVQRIELGYLLFDDEFELPDATLNTPVYVGYSSIQQLVATHHAGASHADLLRGPDALGTLLGNNGYPSVPSQQIPAPGIGNNYFSGGYITANHTSYATDNDVNGVQMECNFSGVRGTWQHRKAFADSLVNTLATYMEVHFELDNFGCEALSTPYHSAEVEKFLIFPNPASHSLQIIYNGSHKLLQLRVRDLNGRVVLSIADPSTELLIDTRTLNQGMYLMELESSHGLMTQKVLINRY